MIKKIIAILLVFIYSTPVFAVDIKELNLEFFDRFNDDCLKYYINKTVERNHDLRKAHWQVEEYRQRVKVQFAQELPSLSVGGNYIANHIPGNIDAVKNNIFSVPFQANYEIDLFLKNRDKTKSTKKIYEASKFDEKSTYLSLVSIVATTYLNVVKFDYQIELQKSLVENKKESLQREQKRFVNGTVSAMDLNNSKKELNNAQTDLNDLIKSRDIALNLLAVLTGESSENSASLKRNTFDKIEYTGEIPTSISSDVVFSRPDIMSVEKQLEAARIDVRVARKEFLPKLNISGIYAFTNVRDSFGSWDSTLAALLAGATLDLFKGGAKFANLRIYKAKYKQMFEQYQQTDLNALQEVNDSLLIIKEDTKTDINTYSNLTAEQNNFHRYKNSYATGVISYPDLLLAQEKYLNVQKNKTTTKAQRFMDYITLYKAVGGKL